MNILNPSAAVKDWIESSRQLFLMAPLGLMDDFLTPSPRWIDPDREAGKSIS